MRLVLDRSANGRGRLLHVGDAVTIGLCWDRVMVGLEWCRFSVTMMAGPIFVIIYRR